MSASQTTKKQQRKARFNFNIEKDIELLKACLQFNPWQFGEARWKDVKVHLQNLYNVELTNRCPKDRVDKLRKKSEKELETYKTGTEEQQTERGNLLEDLKTLIAQSEEPINNFTGEASDGDNNEALPTAATHAAEKRAADTEREELLEKVPSPIEDRKKRVKLSAQDEIVKAKVDHDMQMEKEKIKLEQQKQEKDFLLEDKRLQIEQSRIELEALREARLAEEMRRQNIQFDLFSKMYDAATKNLPK